MVPAEAVTLTGIQRFKRKMSQTPQNSALFSIVYTISEQLLAKFGNAPFGSPLVVDLSPSTFQRLAEHGPSPECLRESPNTCEAFSAKSTTIETPLAQITDSIQTPDNNSRFSTPSPSGDTHTSVPAILQSEPSQSPAQVRTIAPVPCDTTQTQSHELPAVSPEASPCSSTLHNDASSSPCATVVARNAPPASVLGVSDMVPNPLEARLVATTSSSVPCPTSGPYTVSTATNIHVSGNIVCPRGSVSAVDLLASPAVATTTAAKEFAAKAPITPQADPDKSPCRVPVPEKEGKTTGSCCSACPQCRLPAQAHQSSPEYSMQSSSTGLDKDRVCVSVPRSRAEAFMRHSRF